MRVPSCMLFMALASQVPGRLFHHRDVRVLFAGDPAELLHGSLLFDLVLFLQATLSFFLAEKNSPSAITGG